MKFFIIGLHASGKHEIAHMLEDMGLKYGRLFTSHDIGLGNLPAYAANEYEHYDAMDIHDIFENNAYIFMHEHQDPCIMSSYKCFEGLSKYAYDNNDVFVLSLDQFMDIPSNNIPSDAVFVWLDNIKNNRYNRYRIEKCEYNFSNREELEKKDIKEFTKTLYSNAKNIIYFTNEEPCRIATIIYSIHKHPDLLNLFTKNFN